MSGLDVGAMEQARGQLPPMSTKSTSQNKNRTRPATPIYRAVMLAIEERRLALGVTMDELCDRAGVADRLYAKLLHPDTAHGRQAGWATLQELVDAIYPEGCEVELKPKAGERLNPQDLRCRIKLAAFAVAPADKRAHRELMRALGSKGGIARREKFKNMTPAERAAIAKKARKTRRRNRLMRRKLQCQITKTKTPS